MATKTVVSTNMPAARGISIVIDQDQAQPTAVNCKQQQLDAAKITIYQQTNKTITTTTTSTTPEQTTLTRTVDDERQEKQPQTFGMPLKSPATSTTVINLAPNHLHNNHHQHHHNNNADDNVCNDATGNNEKSGEFEHVTHNVTGTQTGYTTATFPPTLLKVAAHKEERGKLYGNNGNYQVKEAPRNDSRHTVAEEKPQLNEKDNTNCSVAGVSITHGFGESNGAVGELAAVSATVTSPRTMIIQCNEQDDHYAHNDFNGDDDQHDEHKAKSGNDESHCNGRASCDNDVGKNGQNAFEWRIGGSGSGSGGGVGVGDRVVDAHGSRLESVHTAFASHSLTSKADCASALTEPVRYADKDTHVVKIQIKPSNQVLEIEKQITVVTLNDKDSQSNKKTEIEKSTTSSEYASSGDKLNVKPDLHLNFEKMVQRPSTSSSSSSSTCVSSVNTVATVVPAMHNSGTGASASSASGNVNNSSGATTVTELNVSHPSYLYYVMSSGQFSPCDTLDSGTGSDLECNNTGTPSPKALTNGNVNTIAPQLELHLKTTKIRVNNGKHGKSPMSSADHARAGSLTDSEESESSSLSCDSLHSTEYMRQSSISPTTPKVVSARNNKSLGSFLPDSLLRDIRDRKFPTNDFEQKYGNGNDEGDKGDDATPRRHHEMENETASEQDYVAVERNTKILQERNAANKANSANQRTSLPNKTFVLNTEDGTFVDTKMNSMPRRYEADKYYNFHVNEHENFRSFGNGMGTGLNDDLDSLSEYENKSIHEDAFAGYKDIRCGSATSTIRSSKGTVRGVKNRVRNGIATFLQLQQPNVKNYKEKDLGKVVLYTTSMGIIRDTYAKCSNVKQILRTLLVKFEERDVFMSIEYQQEIKERMHSEVIRVPQLFVEGQHIGDADTVERLNESGELRQLLKPYKSISTTYTCQTCGGYRLLPCPSCNGSKKSVHRNHFTAEFVALKCMNCDEVGLVKCHNC